MAYRTPTISGIYRIKNTKTGKFYIGQSKNVFRRWNDHLNLLKWGKHHNEELQADFKKYKSGAFTFEILEECKASKLKDLEEEMILNCLYNGENLYNVVKERIVF